MKKDKKKIPLQDNCNFLSGKHPGLSNRNNYIKKILFHNKTKEDNTI